MLYARLVGNVAADPLVNVSIGASVVYEGGQPALGAKVNGWFRDDFVRYSAPATPDASGWAAFTGRSDGNFGVVANQDGFYESILGIETRDASRPVLKDGRYEFALVLRKVQDPVPMYAVAHHRIEFPRRKVVGFDLLECKLMPPYGGGKVADLLLETTCEGSPRSGGVGKLTLRFSHPEDGIVVVHDRAPGGSRLWSPREAPKSGYAPEFAWSVKWPSPNSSPDEMMADAIARAAAPHPDAGYIFRIRTTLRNNGEVESAMYGKIHGVPDWHTHPDSETSFFQPTYYVNPSGTRSLEWKRGENLFKHLKLNEVPFFP